MGGTEKGGDAYEMTCTHNPRIYLRDGRGAARNHRTTATPRHHGEQTTAFSIANPVT